MDKEDMEFYIDGTTVFRSVMTYIENMLIVYYGLAMVSMK